MPTPKPCPDDQPDSRYGVICREHGPQGLSQADYLWQLCDPDSTWTCPIPGCTDLSVWDDDRYERSISE